MDKAGVEKALIQAGLDSLVKQSDLLVRDSIRIFTKPADEQTLPLGASKLGGLPDLSANSKWPQWQGVPQSFIAQIRLEEVQPFDTQKLLPPKGLLSFFYSAQQDTYGDSPSDKGAWQVLFADGMEQLQRTSAPTQLPKEALFKSCSLSYATELTLAAQPELEIPNLKWNNEEQQKYDTVFTAFHEKDALPTLYRMLGFADVLQDDMRVQSQLNSADITDWNSPQAKKLSQEANNWQLLLQIDTDEQLGMNWASIGRLYYWIKASDLLAGQVQTTWCILQSE